MRFGARSARDAFASSVSSLPRACSWRLPEDVIGLTLGYWGVKLLVALNRDRIPRAQDISLDGWVVAFTIGISILTGIVFGLVPALQSSRSDLHETLKEGGRSGSGGTRSGLRSTLVVAEIALALMLLVGAGLLIKSFIKLQQVTPGFQPQNVLVMQLSLPNLKYSGPAQVDGFYQRLLEKVKAIPGVREASTGTNVPLSGSNSSGSFQIENRTFPPGQMSPWGSRAWVGSNYLQTLGIPLIKGRFFDDHDVIDAPGTAIIDETMARKFWADEDPIGKRITFEGPPSQPKWREIVGVVGHVEAARSRRRVAGSVLHSTAPTPTKQCLPCGAYQFGSLQSHSIGSGRDSKSRSGTSRV